jgi:hypothetical protein
MSTLLSSSSTHDGRRRGRRRVVNITLANATAFVVIASMSCVFLSLFLYDIDDLEDAHFVEEGRRKTTTTTTSFDASFHRRDRGQESDDFDDEKTTTTRDDSDVVVHRDDDGLKEKTRAKTTTFRRQNSFPYRYVVYVYIFIYARKIDTLCVSLLFY